jgi:hypothetical protein
MGSPFCSKNDYSNFGKKQKVSYTCVSRLSPSLPSYNKFLLNGAYSPKTPLKSVFDDWQETAHSCLTNSVLNTAKGDTRHLQLSEKFVLV